MGIREHGSSAALRDTPAEIIAGRYRCEAALGKGGAGQVYRVTDLAQGGQLALKRLDPSANTRLLALFELEYQTLASLKHPRIVEVYEFRHHDDGVFYTMELLQGRDLAGQAPMTWREACHCARAAAQALGLLHARKMVHRDVSARNLWRTPDGNVKLIDFGALAPFGASGHVMGTPPYVPPEALHGGPLDQRSDLYALGAVAYYLLTGAQAFPARQLQLLPDLWLERPAAPSLRVAALERSDLEPIPPELDTLIADLLSHNMLGRPSSAAELIDRIDGLLGEPQPAQREGAIAHLTNGPFIGRARELEQLRGQFALAARAQGQSSIIESPAGGGRSRLLREFGLEVQVADAIVLQVDAGACSGLYGVASALALKLLDALPDEAHSLAVPYLASLSRVSTRLRDRLGGSAPAERGDAVGEMRVRVQSALRAWFLALARQHTLVILVDGLEKADDGSSAFLLSLSSSLAHARVLLVCTLLSGRVSSGITIEHALAKASQKMFLQPFSEQETLAMLQSIFGSVEHLGRMAARLHQVANGNPSHLLELTEQLVRSNVIGFAEGAFTLPQEVPFEYLTNSRVEALAARLELLDSDARQLGRVLSLHAGELTVEMCKALAASQPGQLFQRLGELVQAEILVGSEGGCRFSHEQHRVTLLAELAPDAARRAKQALGDYLLAMPEATVADRLRAGVHLMASGEDRGADIAARASLRIALVELDQIGDALPAIEEALTLFRQQERPERELLSFLSPLALAGFYVHRRYASRYGQDAITGLGELLGMALARKLSRFLGRKLGLIAALVVAAIRLGKHRKNPRVPNFVQALQLLFHGVTTLTGSSIATLDPDSAERYAKVIAPLKALGKKRVGTFIHEFGMALARTVRDSRANVMSEWRRLIGRLEKPGDIRGLPDHLRARYLGGALFAYGLEQAQGEDADALLTAERLEQLGLQLYRMGAEQIRTLHYAHQGDLELYARHRARAEEHAIQQGAAWQMEIWTPASLSVFYLRTQDAMGMKRTTEQVEPLGREVPALALRAKCFRGTYLMLRHKYTDALPWLEAILSERPLALIGWSNEIGKLVRLHNRLGNHERAKELGMQTLAQLGPTDLECTPHSLILQTELAIAEAGLGNHALAAAQIDALLTAYVPTKGPLTVGGVYEAGVQVALLANDLDKAREHFTRMEELYQPIRAPGLEQRCRQLQSRIKRPVGGARLEAGEALPLDTVGTGSDSALPSIERMLGGGTMSASDRAQRALQLLIEHTRATGGLLFLLDDDQELALAATLGDEQSAPEIVSAVQSRLARELEDESTQHMMTGEEVSEQGGQEVFAREGRHYRILVLTSAGAGVTGVLGAAVMVDAHDVPKPCSAAVLGSLGYHLSRALHVETSRESA